MSSKKDTLKMTMTPEFQARAMVHVARQDYAGAEAMERDLVALINTKNDLLAACKAALAAVEANAERYPGDREAQRDANQLRAAIARAEGGGECS